MAAKKVTVPVVNQTGEVVVKGMSLDSEVFGVEVNEQAIYNAVQVYQANKRQATAKTKTRAEVSGGGKKPWRQKGTGRARAGSNRSPIWVHGGIVWGPKGNQNFKLSQNKKEHALAVKSALTQKVQDKDVIVIDEIKMDTVSTKAMTEILTKVSAKEKTLLVLDAENKNVELSARNIPGVVIVNTNNLSVYDILNTNSLVFTKAAIKTVEEELK